jgi:hypothetical protein
MTGCGSFFHVQVLKSELWYRVIVPPLNRALDVVFYGFTILGAFIDIAVCSESRYAGDAKPAEPSQRVDLVAMARRRYQRPRVNSLGEGPTKRWTVRYRQDEVNGSGKRVRVCKQSTLGLCSEITRAQAQRAADELLGARANSLQPSTTITFETFVETKYRPNALASRTANREDAPQKTLAALAGRNPTQCSEPGSCAADGIGFDPRTKRQTRNHTGHGMEYLRDAPQRLQICQAVGLSRVRVQAQGPGHAGL